MATWSDVSSNYNGKMLRTRIRISETEIVEASLYYIDEYEEKVNEYNVRWRETTGLHSLVLNSGRMKKSGEFSYTGGLGRTVVISKLHERRTLKELEKVAATLSDDAIIANAGAAEPTVIVGRS